MKRKLRRFVNITMLESFCDIHNKKDKLGFNNKKE
jgi:hypothetical protein